MTMKLWLHIRYPAPEGWVHVPSPREAIELLETGQVTHLDLDYDFGMGSASTGVTVLKHIVFQWISPTPEVTMHTRSIGARRQLAPWARRIAARARAVRMEKEEIPPGCEVEYVTHEEWLRLTRNWRDYDVRDTQNSENKGGEGDDKME